MTKHSILIFICLSALLLCACSKKESTSLEETLPSYEVSAPNLPEATATPTVSPSPTPVVEETQEPEATPQAGNPIITDNAVLLRDKPSADSSVLAILYYGNEVEITETLEDWYGVIVNDTPGYVSSRFVKTRAERPAVSGEEIAQKAQDFLGRKYVYGGNDPQEGFDCSGFVQYVFSLYSIPLNRIATDMQYNGMPVELEEIEPGDILLFLQGGYIYHVGIYIGGDEFVHAQSSDTGVVTSLLSEYQTRAQVWARRVR